MSEPIIRVMNINKKFKTTHVGGKKYQIMPNKLLNYICRQLFNIVKLQNTAKYKGELSYGKEGTGRVRGRCRSR